MDDDLFMGNRLWWGNLLENQSPTTNTTNDPPLHLPHADPTVWNQPCTVSPDGDELDLFDDDNFAEELDCFSSCGNPDCVLCYS